MLRMMRSFIYQLNDKKIEHKATQFFFSKEYIFIKYFLHKLIFIILNILVFHL
jgi:hypothetical protein